MLIITKIPKIALNVKNTIRERNFVEIKRIPQIRKYENKKT